jgi:hypothetical protein
MADPNLNVWKKQEMHTVFCLVNLKERNYLGDIGVDGRIILT